MLSASPAFRAHTSFVRMSAFETGNESARKRLKISSSFSIRTFGFKIAREDSLVKSPLRLHLNTI